MTIGSPVPIDPANPPQVITVTPKWRSPAFWASALVTAAGIALAVPGLLPPSWRPYVEGFVAIMAGLGITALHGVAVNAGNQAAQFSGPLKPVAGGK